MIWTEKTVKVGIQKAMLALNIDRMPTSQELRDNKMSGLGKAISDTGGFIVWSERMGLERKEKDSIWNEERIKEEIFNSVDLLGIKRMPTAGELKSLGRNDLHCAIGRSKRYRGWAEYLGLSLTDCNTRTGEKFELIVKEKLESMGYEVEKMTTKFPYDLLINGKIKVDVKFGNTHNHFGGCVGITFGINKPVQTSDIYILVNLSADKNVETYYIIPSHLLKMKTLNMGLNGKYNRYIDAWDYLKKFNDFYEGII